GSNLGPNLTSTQYTTPSIPDAPPIGAHTLTAVARDAANNAATAAAITVIVNNAPPPDTTPPSVSMTAPADGATVSGAAVTVSATAADNIGVASVQFILDGTNLGPRPRSNPSTITATTPPAVNAPHPPTPFRRDAANNAATAAAITVIVNNAPPPDTTPPSVSMTAPANGATVSGSAVTVSAAATDNIGVASVQF